MQSEKPPCERMDSPSDSSSHYDQILIEMQEKYLPLLERLVQKFPDHKKLYNVLQKKRPSLEWLNKLEDTCEKIQKKMTQRFFEKLDAAEKEIERNSTTNLEKANTEIVNGENRASGIQEPTRLQRSIHPSTTGVNKPGVCGEVIVGMKTPKRSRWDVKPTYDRQINEELITEKIISKGDKEEVLKRIPADENNYTIKKRVAIGNLIKSEKEETTLVREKSSNPQVKKINEQDSEVQILASTAGYNPLRRVRSQTQFATLEEVNKSPFYKKFASDNMILGSRAANLKHGTVADLVKSKAQSSETRHTKYSHSRFEGLPRTTSEKKKFWSQRENYENKYHDTDSFEKNASPAGYKFHVTNVINDKTYDHLQSAVKFFNRNKELKAAAKQRWPDNTSLKTKHEKSGNEFQGKMPFYKQNVSGYSKFSNPETSGSSQSSRIPLLPTPPNPYPAINEYFPQNQSTQYSNIGFPQQTCSFHCNCCKNTQYFSRMGSSCQPTSPCMIGSNNFPFFSGQYFPNQSNSPHSTLPIPFPTYAVPPFPSAALGASIPHYSNVNKRDYSVAAFCSEGDTTTGKTAPSAPTCFPANSHHQELTFSRNSVESMCRSKDPRIDTIKDNSTQSTSNIAQNAMNLDSTSNPTNPRFSSISEKRFSQSCTFLRPDNLYRDFKCHSGDLKNDSFESLKSFGLMNNVTNKNVSNQNDLLNKTIDQDSKTSSNNKDTCKISRSESKKCTDYYHGLQPMCQTDKRGANQNIQHINTQDGYISPLSDLYSDDNSKFVGYTNVMNKKLENRKRKYEEFLGRDFSGSESKRKTVGKVTPIAKVCTSINGEQHLGSKTKQHPVESFSLSNCERHELSTVENSLGHDDTELSTENWGKTKSQTECVEKHCQSYSSEVSLKAKKCKSNHSSLTELVDSKIIPDSQREKCFVKERILEKDDSSKMPKPSDSETKQLQLPENTQVPGKVKSNEKHNVFKNTIACKKSETEIVEPSCCNIIQPQTCEKISDYQKEILGFSKNREKNDELNTNSIDQRLYYENDIKEKVINTDKSFEKNSALKKSSAEKNKYVNNEQSHQKGKSIEKENSSGKISSSNKLINNKNKDNTTISTPQQGKSANDKVKSSEESSSKKTTTINDRNSQNKTIPPKEKSGKQEKCLKNSSSSEKVIKDTIMNDEHKDLSIGIKSNVKEKCLQINSYSKKSSNNKIKDCKVVLKREKSVAMTKLADNFSIENSAFSYCIDNKPSSENLKSHNKGNFIDCMDLAYKRPVSDKSECTDKPVIFQKEVFEEENNITEDIPNDENDKIKDLVLRMKSLSQSEALKVLSEFASTLKVGESQDNISVSKDQTVPSKVEEVEKSPGQIIIEDEIVDDNLGLPEIKKNFTNINTDDLVLIQNTSNIKVCRPAIKGINVSSVKDKLFKSCENTNSITEPTLQGTEFNVKDTETNMQGCHASSYSDIVVVDTNVHKETTKKGTLNKRKSELDKIHADLESCHGLDNLMNCSRLRKCRLKNENSGALKENATVYKQDSKRKPTESSEVPFFIEDEITIKMEPIPESPFDIKQEPDFFDYA